MYHSNSNYILYINLNFNNDELWESRIVKGIREGSERILLQKPI